MAIWKISNRRSIQLQKTNRKKKLNSFNRMNHLEQEKKLCSDSRWAFDARNWSDGNATKKELKRRAFDASFACHQKWGSYSSPPRHLLALSLHSLIASNPFSLRLAWLLVQLLSAKPLFISSVLLVSQERVGHKSLF